MGFVTGFCLNFKADCYKVVSVMSTKFFLIYYTIYITPKQCPEAFFTLRGK
ncbi:hypothetical protein CUS_5532 [Ruminococcus albus 8]|uniref:Uncharacterized protein n=1 Tax=Ruminococcus albus 8 TaxID=246199 RepID=E9S916_RUMAL|nr:hypothetical protein CUS_5532 [Ruminococcus albus 8]